MTDLTAIEREAKMLMTAHGVGSLAFAFDNGKRRIGCTWFKKVQGQGPQTYWLPTKITLSRHFAAILEQEQIRNTMLHEIAHALAGKEAGHGPQWKRIAKSIGCTGERCSAVEVSPEKSVKAYCPKCEAVVFEQHRLPLRVYYHPKCAKIGDRSQALKWFKNGTLVSLSDMPARYRAEFNNVRPVAQPKPKSLEDFFRF